MLESKVGTELGLRDAQSRHYAVPDRHNAAHVAGVLGIVYGEADDSPGLQLLGVVLVLGAVVFGVRAVRRGR